MRRRLAELTSNILNPFLVSFVVIVLLSFKSTPGTPDALKWALISIAISVLPVFTVVVYLVRHQKLDGIFVNPRRQRNKVYLLASACAVVGCVLLSYLGAPMLLVATFVAGLVAIVIFMGINLMWKISLHTAFVAASVTVLIIVYGTAGAPTTVLLPPVAWARIELEHHSPAQVATGALLSAVIVVIVFYLFGLIGAHA
jgi:membrane-associated phospholipid phosphatase